MRHTIELFIYLSIIVLMINESNIQNLTDVFGLSAYESRVLLAAISIGKPALIKQIAEAAHIPRTAVYRPIEHLIDKGFISFTKIQRRKYYVALKPEQLEYLFKQRHITLNKVIREIQPESERIVSPSEELDISYYPGRHGIMTAGQIFLDDTKDSLWVSFENLNTLTSLVGPDFEEQYINQRVQRGIRSKMIVAMQGTNNLVNKFIKNDKNQLRETITVSPSEYNIQSTIAVTEGLTIIINPLEKPFAVLIRNKSIANTLASIHKIVWSRYKTTN